MGLTSSVRRN